MVSAGVWGIDIGGSALKAVRMREGREELEILGLCHLEYDIGEDGQIAATESTEALEELLRRHPEIRKEQALVSRPGSAAFSRFIKIPRFDEGRLDEIVAFEAQQQIPFPVDEVVWGYSPVEPEEEDEDEDREVGLFAIKKELVYGFLADLQLSGLDPDGLTVAPLATYNFVRLDVDYSDAKALVVLDIGFGHTDLIVVDGERYWLRNLTLSGSELTKAIATRKKQTFDRAEEMKRQASGAGDSEAKKLYQATQLVLKDFVSEIHRSIGFYKAQNKDRKVEIGEVLLLGNGSKLPNIRPYFQRELGYPVRTLKRLSALTLDEDLGGDDVELLREQLPAFSVAFGLAIQGCGFGANEVNLLPEEMLLRKALERKKPLVAAALAVILVVVMASYFVAGGTLTATQRVLANAETKLKDLRTNKKKISELQDVSFLKGDVEALAAHADGRNQALEVLNALAAVLPQENGLLKELTAAQERQLLHGNKKAVIDEVLKELRPSMSDLNDKKLWLLELTVSEAAFVAGKVERGEKVTSSNGEEVPVGAGGYFKLQVEQPVGTLVDLGIIDVDKNRTDKSFRVKRGVQAFLTVAKKYGAKEAQKVAEIEDELVTPIRELLPDTRFDGHHTKLFALEDGAKNPPPGAGGAFGGAQAPVQTFLSQRIVVEHPDAKTLAGLPE
ncbi:type IV pilus assembly protein PilM [Planctomycetota bacterium]